MKSVSFKYEANLQQNTLWLWSQKPFLHIWNMKSGSDFLKLNMWSQISSIDQCKKGIKDEINGADSILHIKFSVSSLHSQKKYKQIKFARVFFGGFEYSVREYSVVLNIQFFSLEQTSSLLTYKAAWPWSC